MSDHPHCYFHCTRFKCAPCCPKLKSTPPAVKIDEWIIFSDGSSRRLSLLERWRWRRGKLSTVRRKSARIMVL